jgi:hypothetical protein
MPRRKRFKQYKQGVYKPSNRHKFSGSKLPEYRSSWELKFFRWLDKNENVIRWTSESLKIPYRSPVDGRMHKYITDNVVTIKEGNQIKKYVIEIKPKKQTIPPTKHGNKKQSTIIYENVQYAKNLAKWKAAIEWCRKRNYTFQIITEDHLF